MSLRARHTVSASTEDILTTVEISVLVNSLPQKADKRANTTWSLWEPPLLATAVLRRWQ
jgi:hypothetical protein